MRDLRRQAMANMQKSQRRPLPPDLLHRLEVDALFQVMTSDLQHWIDPFTGTPVPASLGRVPAAKEYLIESGVWKDKETLSRSALEMIRWRMELMRLLPIDPRLRIFRADGRGWLNPFNGEVVEDITREDGKITVRTVMSMARALSTCPQAQAGRMLDNATLMARSQALGMSQQTRQSGSAVFGHQELTDDMARAKNVQQHMLSQLPEVEGFELAVHYSAHSGVSGDFYEVITLPDRRILMLLGDVSGHGMQAALVVATALKTLRFIARQTADLVTLLTQFNNEIKADLIPGQFITMFAAVLDPASCRMTCVRAGHHPALIANLDTGLILRKVGNQGIAIGLVAGKIFQQSLNPDAIALQPGDILLQYTDGLVEAMDQDQQEYGEARLYGSLLSRLELPLQELVDGIAKDVGEFADGNVGDDLTIFSLAVFEIEEAQAESEEPT